MTAPVPTRAELDTAILALTRAATAASAAAIGQALTASLDALYDALEDGRDAQRALDLLRAVSWKPDRPRRPLSAAAKRVEVAWEEGLWHKEEPEYALALAIDAAIRHGQGEPTPEPKEAKT